MMGKRERSPCDQADAVSVPVAKRQRRALLLTTPAYTNSLSPPTSPDPVDGIATARSSQSHGHNKPTHHYPDESTWGTSPPLTAPTSSTPCSHSTSRRSTDLAVEQQDVKLTPLSPFCQDIYQTSEDNSDGSTRLVALSTDLRRGLARSPLVLSTISDAFFAPYDPDFGAKVQARMRFLDERAPFRLRLRIQKYGKEVAERWRRGHTPVEIREKHWEEQEKNMQKYLLEDEDTDFEDMIDLSDGNVKEENVRGNRPKPKDIKGGGKASTGKDEMEKCKDAAPVSDDVDKARVSIEGVERLLATPQQEAYSLLISLGHQPINATWW